MWIKNKLVLSAMLALFAVGGAYADNNPPSVNAGTSQSISSLSTTLEGVISDDGLPNPPGATTALWSVLISSPGDGSVTFADPTKLDTQVTFSQSGVYVLRLTGDDGELSGSDEVRIVVSFSSPTINLAPEVNAGIDQSISGLSTTLAGVISDDGLPNPPGATTALWSVLVSSPDGGNVIFADATKLDTQVTFSQRGVYILKLTGDDGELSGSDEVRIVVSFSSPTINLAPEVNAGIDQSISGLSTTLAGVISDDGLPNPPGATTALWSVLVSSPDGGNVIFADATKLDTQVTFPGPGIYTLLLTGSDGALMATDTVVINVRELRIKNRGGANGFLGGTKNKFNPSKGEKGSIFMDLTEDGPVRVSIRSVDGRIVKESIDSSAQKGVWSFEWDGRDDANRPLASGLYPTVIYQNDREIKKITFIIIR